MGIRPSSGQTWKRYAVVGDPRPVDGQVWPRYSGVYVPPSGDMFFSYYTGEVWPLGTAGPVGVSFGPEDPSVYQWATHYAPGSPATDDWLEFSVPEADTPTVDATLVRLRDIDGNEIGSNLFANVLFHFYTDETWPFATPGNMPYYFDFENSGFDIWTTFGIPGETTPPIAGDPVYCDVPVHINGQPYTIRYFNNGYIVYGPFSLQMEFDALQDSEFLTDWLHIVMTIDFIPDAVFYQISLDNGATWNNLTRLIIPDPLDPSRPNNPESPMMYDYNQAEGKLDVLLGLYNFSSPESAGYQDGITNISGMFFRVVVNPPGYGSTVESGALFGEFGPVPPPTHFSTPTNPIYPYQIDRPM